MKAYTAYNLSVASALPLPELRSSSADGEADVYIRTGTVPALPLLDGEERSCQVDAQGATLHWARYGTYRVQGGREIIAQPHPEAADVLIRQVLLGVCAGVLLHQRGLLTLHASAVALGGRAVAFVGPKGWGKSTTAAALHRRGHALLTDDVLALDLRSEVPLALPAFPQIKLREQAATALHGDAEALPLVHPQFARRAVRAPEQFQRDPLPLGRVYVLGSGPELSAEPLPPHLACVHLLAQTYAARFLGKEGAGPDHFQQTGDVARTVPVYALVRPFDVARIDDVVRLVEEHAEDDGSAPS